MRLTSMLVPGVATTIILAACSTTASQPTRSAEAEADLAKALAGRTAGTPVRCIPTYRADDMVVIDDWTILFKDGSTIYLQSPPGGCSGIAVHRNVLISRPMPSSELCSGDIQHLFDPVSRIGGGSCVFGDFVPYTKTSG